MSEIKIDDKGYLDEKSSIKDEMLCLLGALILGIVFDRFFIERYLDIKYTIFIALVIVFVYGSLKNIIKPKLGINLLFLSVILFLAIYFALRTNETIYALNFMLVPFLIIAATLVSIDNEIKWYNLNFIFRIINKGILGTLANFDKPIKYFMKGVNTITGSRLTSAKKQVIKGLLICIPLLAIVVVLLSSADQVFNYYLLNITELFVNIRIDELIAHTSAILFITFYLFAYVWSFKNNKIRRVEIEESKSAWEAITNITVIMAIDFVYLIFTVIQFSYLYGGGTSSLPTGFTYAEYARRGFFELVTIAVINYILVLLSLKNTKKEKGVVTNTIKILITLLIIFTLSMLYSAHYKLSLYEVSFGFTYLRVYVHLFMIVMLVLCILAIISIWTNKITLSKSLVITLILGYTAISYINVDAFIAKKNIERYKNTGNIDLRYITSLSYEAVPYLIELVYDQNTEVAKAIKNNLKVRKSNLEEERSEFGFNLSKQKARSLLNSIELQ